MRKKESIKKVKTHLFRQGSGRINATGCNFRCNDITIGLKNHPASDMKNEPAYHNKMIGKAILSFAADYWNSREVCMT